MKHIKLQIQCKIYRSRFSNYFLSIHSSIQFNVIRPTLTDIKQNYHFGNTHNSLHHPEAQRNGISQWHYRFDSNRLKSIFSSIASLISKLIVIYCLSDPIKVNAVRCLLILFTTIIIIIIVMAMANAKCRFYTYLILFISMIKFVYHSKMMRIGFVFVCGIRNQLNRPACKPSAEKSMPMQRGKNKSRHHFSLGSWVRVGFENHMGV